MGNALPKRGENTMSLDNSGYFSPDSLNREDEGASRFSSDSLDCETQFKDHGRLSNSHGEDGKLQAKGSSCTVSLERDEFQEEDCNSQEKESAADYLDREVFPILLPAFEKMLFAARENDVLKVQKSRFNGLDYLAELLWNRNPLHPEREDNYKTIFEIPFAKRVLDESPRPVFPRSWLWSPEEAAIVLQAAVRGFLVRVRPEVQELRQFWKALALETRGRLRLEGSCQKESSSGQLVP